MTAPRSENAILNKLLAGQAASDQRFEEILRRLDRAEETAGEARDTARELVTILREQDTGAKMVELRTEFRAATSEMRQDFVAANSRVRHDVDDLATRIASLEAERNKVVGVAAFASWLSKVAPWLLAGLAAFAAGVGFKDGG